MSRHSFWNNLLIVVCSPAVGKARSCSNSTEKPLITAAVAFQLSDTYGFPLDLTEMICNERGLRVDLAGAEKLMEEQRARSKGLVDKNAQHKETKGEPEPFPLSASFHSNSPQPKFPF